MSLRIPRTPKHSVPAIATVSAPQVRIAFSMLASSPTMGMSLSLTVRCSPFGGP